MVDTVKTVKSSLGDYSSLSAWDAGQQKVIAAGDRELAECYSFNDTTQCTIDGWTTASNASIYIYTPAAERHAGVWNTGKYYLSSNAAGGTLIINEEYVTVEGLQVANGTAADSSECAVSIGTLAASSSVKITESILRHTNGGRFTFRLDGTAGTAVLQNCILYGDSVGAAANPNGGTLNMDNVTGIGATYGSYQAVGPTTARNCYFSGTTSYQGTHTLTTSASSDATTGSVGLRSIAYSTANFTNVTAGSENLHLVSGSALIDVGTDLSASFTVDIDGVTRSGTWDIGADEYVAAAGGQPYIKRTGGVPFMARNRGIW